MKISKTTIAAILMSIIMIATTATGCGTKLETEDQSPVQTQDDAIINDSSSNTMESEQNTSSHIVSSSTSKDDTNDTQTKSSSSSATSKSKTSTSSITSESKSSTNAKASNGSSAKKNNSTASTHTPTNSTNTNSSKAANSSNESHHTNTTTVSSKTSNTSASTTNKTTNNTSSKQTSSKTASANTSSKVSSNSSRRSTQSTVVSSTPSKPQTTSSEVKTSKPTHQHTPVTKTETKYETKTTSLKLKPNYDYTRHYYEYLVSVFKCAVCGEEAVYIIYCYQDGTDWSGMKEVLEVPDHPEFMLTFMDFENWKEPNKWTYPDGYTEKYNDHDFGTWFHRHYTDCNVSPYQIDHHITWIEDEYNLLEKRRWYNVDTDIDVETTYEWTECSECGKILESKHEISTVEHMPEMEDPVETYWEGPFAYEDEQTIKTNEGKVVW